MWEMSPLPFSKGFRTPSVPRGRSLPSDTATGFF